ncbi:MAG: hypothetical protein AAGA58_09005, partial [Verrucomicrobiota bacterium]
MIQFSRFPGGAILAPSLLAAIFFVSSARADDIFVDRTASGNNDGNSWKDAFVALQDALAAASSGDTIHIAEGPHYPDEGAGITNNDPDSTFSIPPGVDLQGGYSLGGADFNPGLYVTILSGDIDGDDDDFDGDFTANIPADVKGTNAYHVVTVETAGASRSLLNLTITAGSAKGAGTNGTLGGG